MKFKALLVPFTFSFAVFLAGCGIDYDTRIRTTRYKPETYQKIKSWSVKLAYGDGVQAEPSRSIRGDLSFCEEVSSRLSAESATIRIDPAGEGCISVCPNEYGRSGYPHVVSIKFIDASGTVLSQMKIWDTSGDGTIASFQHYIALHIIRELSFGSESK